MQYTNEHCSGYDGMRCMCLAGDLLCAEMHCRKKMSGDSSSYCVVAAGNSPRAPHVLKVLVDTFQAYLRPGVPSEDLARTGLIDPNKMIENLGDLMSVVDRDQATIRLLKGV